MINCRRGDVVLAAFPNSNLRTAKRRPALVVQADYPPTDLPQTIVAMISSNMARAGYPQRISIIAGTESSRHAGLLLDSVIMTDNLTTIREEEIYQVIGRFDDLESLNFTLRVTLGL